MNFTKMHGLGNDFIVIDNTAHAITLSPDHIQQLAHRNFGIGFDQLLIVETNTTGDADFNYRIYNADGGEVGQCGNGARCFAKYVYDHNLTTNTTITAKTMSGIISLTLGATTGTITQVSVDMGVATHNPSGVTTMELLSPTVMVAGYELGIMDIGNPHAIYQTSSLATEDVVHIGTTIQQSPVWTHGVNVNIVEITSPTEITLETYERGSGHTLACGTGACAAVAFLHQMGAVENTVTVHMRGGSAVITAGEHVVLSGPAETVFTGTIAY